jgi:uncharacterized protein YndB with AHSA1/START domain
MDEATRVSRTVDTELSPDELWALLTDGERWATWMVDQADVTVTPGAGGSVVDDGVERTVRIDRLEEDGESHRVAFTWWADDRPDLVSSVELVVLPAVTGSRLHVTETYATASAARAAVGRLTWDVRLLLLAAQALAVLV